MKKLLLLFTFLIAFSCTKQGEKLVTIPVGEYAVSGYFHPTKVQNVVGTGHGRLPIAHL